MLVMQATECSVTSPYDVTYWQFDRTSRVKTGCSRDNFPSASIQQHINSASAFENASLRLPLQVTTFGFWKANQLELQAQFKGSVLRRLKEGS